MISDTASPDAAAIGSLALTPAKPARSRRDPVLAFGGVASVAAAAICDDGRGVGRRRRSTTGRAGRRADHPVVCGAAARTDHRPPTQAIRGSGGCDWAMPRVRPGAPAEIASPAASRAGRDETVGPKRGLVIAIAPGSRQERLRLGQMHGVRGCGDLTPPSVSTIISGLEAIFATIIGFSDNFHLRFR